MCVKKKKERCSNIAVMMASSTRESQITPSSWALTFEVTFKVWLQHQSCQHLSRRDICFCSSAKQKSVGFYGSSFVKVKEDTYIFWTQRVCKGGRQNDEQLGSCQIICVPSQQGGQIHDTKKQDTP